MLREKLVLKFNSSQPFLLMKSMLSTLQPAGKPSTSHGDPSAATSRKVHPGGSSSCGSYAAKGVALLNMLA